MHDLVIDNALLIDGTGAPARHGGVAVKDGRIAAVGLHGVWVNGTRAVDEKEPLRDCGRPGRLLREFDA